MNTKNIIYYILNVLAIWPGLLFSQSFIITSYNSGNSSMPSNTVYDVEVDQEGNWWVATEEGLMYWNQNNQVLYDEGDNGLMSSDIRCITRQGSDIWIGSFMSGVYKIQDDQWIHYDIANANLPSNYVKDIAINNNGEMAIATTNGLGIITNGQSQNINNQNSLLISNNITSLKYDADNVLWAGCTNGGLYMRKNEKEESIWTYVNSFIFDNSISDLSIDDQNQIWMASPYAGLQLYSANSFYVFNPNTSPFPYHSGSAVNATKDSYLLVGTIEHGIFLYNETAFLNINQETYPQLGSNHITSFAWIDDNSFLAGTADAGFVKITLNPLGMENNSFCQPTLYVNTQANQINIDCKEYISSYAIISMDGNVISNENYADNHTLKASINYSNTMTGIYIVQVVINGRPYNQRVFLQ